MKFLDFKYQKKLNTKHIFNFKKIINKSNYILGKEVEIFEEKFANFCNHKYSVGTSSGTDALFLALKLLDLKKTDEVILPAHTFIATALSVHYVECKIILCDVNPDTLLMDLEKLPNLITKNTKVIIPVHLYGMAVDIKKIKQIIKKRKIFIVEDASQAHGLNHFSNRVFKGDLSIFSLYPGKNLGANGDAGIIITNKKKDYIKLKKLRNWGGVKKYKHELIGYNMRMDTIQASILLEKLKHLHKWNLQRIKIANFYNEEFKMIKDLNINHNVAKPHVYHLYVILTNYRKKLQTFLKKNNIETIIHYPKPINKHLAFKNKDFFKKDFDVSNKITKNCLSIPIYPEMKLNDQKKVVSKIKYFFNNMNI
jgi:dTDP-4-amino-4,6-dideoxygalactose transaminase